MSDVIELTDEEMAKAYRRLGYIEKCFNILKSDLEIRPFYLHKDECIVAHIFICFVALFFIQLVRYATDFKVTSYKLRKAFKNLTGKNKSWSYYELDAYHQNTYETLTELGFNVININNSNTIIKRNIVNLFAHGWTKALIKNKLERERLKNKSCTTKVKSHSETRIY